MKNTLFFFISISFLTGSICQAGEAIGYLYDDLIRLEHDQNQESRRNRQIKPALADFEREGNDPREDFDCDVSGLEQHVERLAARSKAARKEGVRQSPQVAPEAQRRLDFMRRQCELYYRLRKEG